MTLRFDRTWPGIHPSAWDKLNKLAEAVETALDWRTDGTVYVTQGQGSMYATVPPPPGFPAVILGGGQPYSWAKLKADTVGAWYTDPDTPFVGWCAQQQVSIIIAAVWVAGTITFQAIDDLSAVMSVGQTIFVTGVNPSGYDGNYTVLNVIPISTGTQFTVAQSNNPGTYVDSGAVCLYGVSANTVPFHPAYEENGNTLVPIGAVVRMLPRVLNSDTTTNQTDEELRFPWQPCCVPIQTPIVPSMELLDDGQVEDFWNGIFPFPSGVTSIIPRVTNVFCINGQIVYTVQDDVYINGQLVSSQ